MEVLKKKTRDVREMLLKANVTRKNYKRAKEDVEHRLPSLNTHKGDADGDIHRELGKVLGSIQ